MLREKVTTIIVTHNRKKLLLRCVDAVRSQSFPSHHIFVIDNCSTDGTYEVISAIAEHNESISYFRLATNTGGAGGFHEGMRLAIEHDDGWLWLMDDDAIPEPSSLVNLIREADNTENIYGSVAIEGKQNDSSLCWPIALLAKDGSTKHVNQLCDIPQHSFVGSLPFLGFMIHTSLIRKIGLPEKGYFLSGDDTEYCIRARTFGANIRLIKSSIIQHPVPRHVNLKLGSLNIRILLIQPWKRYYDTRNRILIARKYYGLKVWTHTLPGTLLRWGCSLWCQDKKFAQSKAFLLGIIDGISGRSGVHWQPGSNKYK